MNREDRQDDTGAVISPWMAPLDPKSRDAVRRNVAAAPPLTDRQRERLRLLFRDNRNVGVDNLGQATTP
jgi:hypothetical protein